MNKILFAVFAALTLAVSVLVVAAVRPCHPVATIDQIRPVATPKPVVAPEAKNVVLDTVVIQASPKARKTARNTQSAAQLPKRDWHQMDQGPVGRAVRDI